MTGRPPLSYAVYPHHGHPVLAGPTALEEGHLQPLSSRQLKHRISLYADDVAIFLKPDPADINLVLDILQLFGMASGLQTNVQKSCPTYQM
jgi:hypothetical protein